MTEKKGVARLRQAIENQRDAGEGEFRLTYGAAEEIAAEIDAELLGICSSAVREIGRYAWAYGVPAPVDADGEVVPLGTTELYTDDGEMLHVGSICFNGRSWYVFNLDNCKPCWLKALHRTEQDSWEKLEEDIGSIKNDAEDCTAGLVRDVLRRAKALAGRSED
jgi:hypothetical protein